MVAGPRADVEHAVVGRGARAARHIRATTSGWEIVCPQRIGSAGCPTRAGAGRGHECLARDGRDRLEHALVGDVAAQSRHEAGRPPLIGSPRGVVRSAVDPATFRLPVERMRDGYYSDRTSTSHATCSRRGPPPARPDAGLPEAGVGARRGRRGARGPPPCAGRHRPDGDWGTRWAELEVRRAVRGRRISPHQTVHDDRGRLFAVRALETVYLGCMARRTLVMRNVNAVVRAARGKPILFFPARHDHWLVQTGDGWAAPRGRRDRRLDRRAGVVVGRARRRDRAARADRGLRRRHGRCGDGASPSATTTT